MAVTNFFWDGDNLLQEYDAGGATVAHYLTEPNLYGNVTSQRRSGQAQHFHFDTVGSTTELTDDSGSITDSRRYTAFGESTEEAGNSEYAFLYVGQKGYYYDTTAMQYYVRMRVYQPARHRWLSVDPTGVSVQELNSYTYVENAPVTAIDPSGLSLCTPDPPNCPQRHADPFWYGCFCGGGNPPPGVPARRPIDPVDSACERHDQCYVLNGCVPARRLGLRIVYDLKPACVECDRRFCRDLRVATCNRYPRRRPPQESPEYDYCVAFRDAAMLIFGCRDRFGIPPHQV